MAEPDAAEQREEPGDFLVGLGRGFGSALIFSLPMLMTMEMWQLGFHMERWRLAVLLASSVPLLMFLAHHSGFESTWGWREDARDVAIALGIGVFGSAAILWLLAVIGPGMSSSEIMGKIAIHAIPAAIGALLGRSQLGGNSDKPPKDETYGGELGVMAVGALFLGFNVAPTEEMMLIAFRMHHWQALVLIGLSLLIMHGFVYAGGFKGGSEVTPGTPWWSVFLRFTVVGYVVALAMSAYLLWCFGRFDGMAMERCLRVLVVLGFPAAIGAAAARLIL